MRLARLALLVVVATLLSAASAQAATQFIGFNPRFASAMQPNDDAIWPALNDEGASVWRITVDWCALEPRQPDSTHPDAEWNGMAFTGLINQVATAESHQVKPIIVIDTTAPGFARYPNLQGGSPPVTGCTSPPAVDNPPPVPDIPPPAGNFAPGPSSSVPGWYQGAVKEVTLCLLGLPICPGTTQGDLLDSDPANSVPGIMGLEFGNEPNLSGHWQTGICTIAGPGGFHSNWTSKCPDGPDEDDNPDVGYVTANDAVQYAAMAQQAALGAHAAASNHGGSVKVTTAGLNWPRGDAFPSDNVNPMDYLIGIYTNVVAPAWDAVGIHPYAGYATNQDVATWAIQKFNDDVQGVDHLIHADMGDDAQIWVTEVGTDSGQDGHCQLKPSLVCTQDSQRQALRGIANAAVGYCPAPTRLRLLAFYNLEDDGGANGQRRGVLTEPGNPKLAYTALQNFYAGGQPTC